MYSTHGLRAIELPWRPSVAAPAGFRLRNPNEPRKSLRQQGHRLLSMFQSVSFPPRFHRRCSAAEAPRTGHLPRTAGRGPQRGRVSP